MNLSKTLEIQLTDKTQQNVRDKQRIENQKTELKKLNEKVSKVGVLNNEINNLKKLLKAEKEKTKLAKASEIQEYKVQISNLESKIRSGIHELEEGKIDLPREFRGFLDKGI